MNLQIARYVLLGICLFHSPLFEGQDNTFYRKYNLGGMQGGLQITTTSDGGFVATGQHEGNGSAQGCDIYAYRVDVCGNLVWFKLVGLGASEGGKSITQTEDGGFIIAGHSDSFGFNLKLDADGNTQWVKRLDGTSWVMYSEEAANGDILSLGHPGLKLIRSDSNGSVLWSKELSGFGDMGLYLHEMANGDIIVSSVGNGSGNDFSLIRLTSTGNIIWSKGYGSGWGDSDHTSWSNRGTVDEAANVITLTSPTYAGSQGGENILVAQVNLTSGDVVWSKSYGGDASDQSRDITTHPGGFAIVGNTASYNTPADPANNINEALGERDILLFSTDFQGNLEWAKTYGGSERDKGIGVRFNNDNGYTISAYTSSPYFGNFDDSMDPLFMKTDSLGWVSCQMFIPTLTVSDITLTATDQGSIANSSITSSNVAYTPGNYEPFDIYVCQNCSTEPIFEPSDTLICTGEQVQFINTTQIGLTCFQEWQVNGETYNGGNDLNYTFSSPGDYTIELYSTCGNTGNTYEMNLHVYETNSTYTTSEYNNYNISCFEGVDGSIIVQPTDGYLGPNGSYSIEWDNGETEFNISSISAGTYSYVVSDAIGCLDSNTIVMLEPDILQASGAVLSNYNGFGVSCFNGNNGAIQFESSGGNGNLTYTWDYNGSSFSTGSNPAVDLYAGDYTFTVQDEYNCGPIILNFEITEPPPLEFTIDAVSSYNGYAVSCSGASDATIAYSYSGGIEPHSLYFNGGVVIDSVLTGLPAGGNNFQLLDLNACQLDTSIELSQPPPLTAVIDIITSYNGFDISCYGAFDGQAGIIAEGGTSPFFYLWSDGSVNSISDQDIGAGLVSVEISDANGCQVFTDTILTEPDPLSVSIDATTDYNGFEVSCPNASDGMITSDVFGGTGVYNYLWHSVSSNTPDLMNVPRGVYLLEVTDNNFCGPVFDSIQLYAPEELTMSLESLNSFQGFDVSCASSADGGIGAIISGGVIPYNTNWSTGESDTMAISGLTAATYTMIGTDANGCTIQQSLELVAPPPITLNTEILSNYNGFPVSCNTYSDGVIQVIASGGVEVYSVQWSNGSNNWINDGLTAGTYEVLVTDINNCSAVSSIQLIEPDLVQFGLPVVSNYNGVNVSCFGSNDGSVELFATGGTGGYEYQWMDGEFSVSRNDLFAGDYSVTVFDLNGCSADTLISLTEPSSVEIVWQSASDYNGYNISCHDFGDGELSAEAAGGIGQYSYHWNTGISANNSMDQLSAGIYSLYTTDENNCESDLIIYELTEPEVMTANVTVVSNYNYAQISCYGASDGGAELIVSGGVPDYTCLWADGSTNFISNNFLNDGLHIVEFWDANNCYGSIEFEIEEPEPLSIVIDVISDYNGSPISCFGMSDGALLATVEGGTGMVSADWSNGFQGLLNPAISAGNYFINCTDVNGCVAQGSIEINEPPILSNVIQVYSDFNGADISCVGAMDGQAITFPSGGIEPYSYLWSDGSTDQMSGANLAAGIASVFIEDANGCGYNDAITLNNPPPISLTTYVSSNYSGYGVSCFEGNNGQISTLIAGGTGSISYNWSNGGVNSSLNNIPAGFYSVTISDENGCTVQGDLLELTQPDALQGQITLVSNYNGFNVSCFGVSDGTSEAFAFGGVPDYTFNWSNGNSGYYASGLSQGMNFVTIQDANGCQEQIQVNLTAPPQLNLSAQSISDTCQMGLGMAYIEATGGNGNCTFVWSNGVIGSQSCCLMAGEQYNVVAYDQNLCEETVVVTVENVPPPQIAITLEGDEPICIDSSEVSLRASEVPVYIDTVDGNVLQYEGGENLYWKWYINDILHENRLENITMRFTDPGNVTVKLTGAYYTGCESEIFEVLKVEDVSTLFVPNAFSPGNDGINDAFVVKGDQIESYDIKIFDHWGNIYFQSNDLNEEWNGTYFNSNINAKPDVYIYEIKTTGICGEEKEEIGHVILLR